MSNTILVAEDDIAVRKVIVELLEIEGHRVQEADDGEACLEALNDSVFDLLVLDLMMPRMDGFAVIPRIRQAELHTGKHIPILCMTGVYTRDFAANCYRLGGDAFVEKPFSRVALLGKIQELLELRRSTGDSGLRELALLDYAGTLTKFNGMEQVVRELLELFSQESRERIQKLLDAWQQGDLKEVRTQAHTLKSISGTIGAQRMSHYSGRLEDAAERGNREHVSNLVPLVRMEMDEVHQKIGEIL